MSENALVDSAYAGDQPAPLLRWTEDKVMAMMKSTLPVRPGRPINYDLLTNLVRMAYDGFVINRRLNDVRDMEMLVNTMCDIILRDDDAPA